MTTEKSNIKWNEINQNTRSSACCLQSPLGLWSWTESLLSLSCTSFSQVISSTSSSPKILVLHRACWRSSDLLRLFSWISMYHTWEQFNLFCTISLSSLELKTFKDWPMLTAWCKCLPWLMMSSSKAYIEFKKQRQKTNKQKGMDK